MSKEIDEIKEKIALIPIEEENLEYINCVYHLSHKIINQILKAETPTHRIAIVKKQPELPSNPFSNLPSYGRERGYAKAQQDMLDAGFVQEEKNGS